MKPLVYNAALMDAWWTEGGALWSENGRFRERLPGYLEELCAWNQNVNLTGCKEFSDLLRRHVQDVSLLSSAIPAASVRCVDIGSGAGLPGMVLALMSCGAHWLLVESNQKKARFLRHVAQTLSLESVTVHPDRAEAPPAPFVGRCDVVTSRAVGSLSLMVKLSRPYLRKGGLCLAMKGDDHPAEIQRYLDKPVPGFSPPELIQLGPRSWLVRLERFT